MEHPDLAQLAAVVAAVGAALLVAGRGRAMVLGGIVVLGLGTLGLTVSIPGFGKLDALVSVPGAVAALAGLTMLAGVAAVFVRRPAWVPLAVLVAAPLRPPISFDPGGSLPITLAEDGQLGRLLPLYFVLAAAALALVWRALHHDHGAVRPLPRVLAFPAGAFIAFGSVSLVWADEIEAGIDLLAYFTLPFALLLGLVGRSPFPEWAPRALARLGLGLAALFALVGLFQAATRELFFFAPNLEVSNANTDYFRVTSLFGDPSLYGRHLVLGMGVVLVLLALKRVHLWAGVGLLAIMWAGLFFSYSQSSMVALVAVTLAIGAATGDGKMRRLGLAGLAVALLLAVAYLASIEIRGESLRQRTADRSQRVEDTARVVREDPIVGVGIGGQPQASRRLSGRDRTTPNFVSHTTPLTVAAELGLVGLVLYVWLLAGGARLLMAVRRLEPALGLALGASFLVLFVHALFYSGFLEDPLTWVVLGVGAGYLTWPRRDDGVRREAPAGPDAADALAAGA
ncbi:MAG: O-antigen ligase family protein [Actinomycetota bacterium]|nr:O-antigen ligase family protein [Actinomycetota bacterium]